MLVYWSIAGAGAGAALCSSPRAGGVSTAAGCGLDKSDARRARKKSGLAACAKRGSGCNSCCSATSTSQSIGVRHTGHVGVGLGTQNLSSGSSFWHRMHIHCGCHCTLKIQNKPKPLSPKVGNPEPQHLVKLCVA